MSDTTDDTNREEEKPQGRINFPALPDTRAGLLATRRMVRQPSLIDRVEEYHALLWDSPEYREFHQAVFDEDAVEGDLDLDDAAAAQMIRTLAREQKDTYVGTKTTKAIRTALRWAVKRFENGSREERREAGLKTSEVHAAPDAPDHPTVQ